MDFSFPEACIHFVAESVCVCVCVCIYITCTHSAKHKLTYFYAHISANGSVFL